MVRRIRSSAVLASVLVVALAGAALAVVAYGPREPIKGNYAYNYSNSMDFTGTPGAAGFRLHEAFVTDGAEPAQVSYTKSADGTSWSKPKKLSGSDNAEGSSLATAGTTVIAGWMTGYSYYDPDGANRRVQVRVSTDSGGTWGSVKNLSSGTGMVDYPIVAAAEIGGTTNVYAAWVDSNTCKVRFRQSSNGGGTWSSPITLGATTAELVGAAYGCAGYANIAAVEDLISVAWIADDSGTLKVRSINASGVAAAPATLSNWNGTTTLDDKISNAQNGFPILGSSPLAPDVIAIAYNTNAAQRYTTFTGGGSSATAAGKTIYTNGTIGPVTYGGGYSTAVEPAPGGGFVAMWAGCRDVIASPCNYGSAKAKFDLLASSSADGTTWSAPARIETSSRTQTLNDEASIVVIPDDAGVKVFAQYNAYNSRYSYYDVWMKIGTGSL
ncbi:MAG: sialidase family protein [Actinomycetota bacterium]